MEEKFLQDLEKDIDTYVSQVVSTEGEVLYKEKEPEQLMLFEEIRKYLADKQM